MENLKNIRPEETSMRWIKNGWAVVGEKAKLNTLQVGQFFIKDNLISYINVVNKAYVSYYDIIIREHCTTNTDQYVQKVKLVGDKNNGQHN